MADPKRHDTLAEPQNNSKNSGTNFTRDHMGQIPVIRCFVQNFYMVAYVTKAGLGPEPEFALFFFYLRNTYSYGRS